MLDTDSGLLKNWLSFGLEAFQILTSRTGYMSEGIIISKELYWKMEWISQEHNVAH